MFKHIFKDNYAEMQYLQDAVNLNINEYFIANRGVRRLRRIAPALKISKKSTSSSAHKLMSRCRRDRAITYRSHNLAKRSHSAIPCGINAFNG